ncbi:MAG TPA: HAD family phosphatase [Cellulomonas sp.]|uniref:HAD family hydrolase n=1 Tax=Cellulomonas sp. TaxID=40001 RepID=UPI002E33ADF1|nr:HAD family phosphatase [Cellulomonas sp.]HEX5331795.1 HAD family phosphatase [Cellulomonas sp.]
MTSPDAVSTGRATPHGGPLPAAVLWDMDGTLIDSEPYWMSAETELVEAHGGVWTRQDALAMIGNSMSVCTVALRSRGVDLSDDAIRDFLHERVAAGVASAVPWQAGAEDLLASLVAAGVPLALVTSSFSVLADPFARMAGVFDVVVSGDEVRHPKPHPEPYLTAAERLGVDISRCVAIEDSPSGLASARSAGARVIAVEVLVPVVAPVGVSRVRSLEVLGLGELTRIVTGDVLDLRGVETTPRA